MNGYLKVFSHLTAIVLVMATYLFLAYTSINVAAFSKQPNGHYQYLADSFLAGHTYLLIPPPSALLKLENPYEYKQNYRIQFPDGQLLHTKLHDVSLYANKFYLYFGPLPVISLYIPCKLITGYYPPDCFAVFLFLSLGFLICYGLLWQIKKDYFPQVTSNMMIFCGLLIGFASNAPFLLLRPSFYEVAIASGFCFLSAAIFFLYRIFHLNFKIMDVILLNTMLGLSVAGRPHFILVAIVLTPMLIFYMWKSHRLNIFTLLSFFPIVLIGILLLTYNYLRFHSIFEFGQAYQLIFDTHGLPAQLRFFDLKDINFNILEGLYNYFFRPFVILNTFPFAFFPDLFIERIKHGNIYEGSFGLLKTAPFVILIVLLPWQCISYFKKSHIRPLLHFIFALTVVTSIIILFLISLNSNTQRYISDFGAFVIMLAIFSFWLGKTYWQENFKKLLKIFFCISGVFSIYIGIVQAKSLTMAGLYFRNFDLSFINYFVFLSLMTLEIFLICSLIRRSSQFKS